MNDINLSEILGIVTSCMLPFSVILFFFLITVTIIIRIISADSNKGSHSSNHQEEKPVSNDIYLYAVVLILIYWIIFR